MEAELREQLRVLEDKHANYVEKTTKQLKDRDTELLIRHETILKLEEEDMEVRMRLNKVSMKLDREENINKDHERTIKELNAEALKVKKEMKE